MPGVPANTRQDGFTLIEMIVVIVIMTVVASLVLVRQPWHSAGLNTDVTIQALSNALRVARSRAIAQDRAVVVVTAESGFSLDGAAVWRLPAGEAFSQSQMIFLPDGGSSGGTVLLAAGARRLAVDVNWLTGRVRWHEVTAR